MTPEERRALIDSALEGEISAADFVRLEAELSADPLARRDYLQRIWLSVMLEAEAEDAQTADNGSPNGAAPALTAATPMHSEEVRSVSPGEGAATAAVPPVANRALANARWILAMGAGLALAVSSVVLWWTNHPPEGAPVAGTPPKDRESRARSERGEQVASGFAVVSGQEQAVWDDGQALASGSLVPPRELHLVSGLVKLELFSGVTVVFEGESRFSIRSPMEVVVTQGRLRARVPEPAHGFRVRTAGGRVIDLGTEFGLDVGAEATELHVLSGEVQWQPEAGPAQRLREGEASRLDAADAGAAARFPARPADFVGPAELQTRLRKTRADRMAAWLKLSERLGHDPRLLAHYQVTAADVLARRLANRAAGPRSLGTAGTLVAASPAASRWGQADSALDFSPAGSRVRLAIPGVHRALTLMCWVKINSLDRWYNSLFLTDGHEQGEPHWQIMDDGRLFFSVKKRDQFDRSRGERDKHIYFSPPFWRSELSGQWLMLATVYDVDARRVTHFLNGEILSREAIPEEYLVEEVKIGNASIGNWGLPERDEPRFAIRNLNGSLDEFALFAAALTDQEIRKLYEDGKP